MRCLPFGAGLSRAVPLAGAAVLAAAVIPALAGPASAGTLPLGCSQAGNTVTCAYTAAGQTAFTVPARVTSVTATAVGAQGGADYLNDGSGGLGAVASGTLAVAGGQVLYLEVGILGGAGRNGAGAGGGESDVRTCPAAGPCPTGTTLESRLLVAGGGGGKGFESFGSGANAGTGGAAAEGAGSGSGIGAGGGGGGATLTAPGTGGSGCTIGGCTAGASGDPAGGAGGAGGTGGGGGGGGGAGWFGGGGGGGAVIAGGDGGGGSSYAAPSVTGVVFSQAASGQAPSVTLTYTAPAACTTTVTGTHPLPLTVTSGTTCLNHAVQDGHVAVGPGAALVVTSSTINGTVTATDAAAIAYCGSTEHGTLAVTGTAGAVTLGGTAPDGTPCAADTIPSLITITGTAGPVMVTGLRQDGTLTLKANVGGVTLDGSRINGLAYVQGNAGTAPVIVTGNVINGSLHCTGNTPAPGDDGAVSTVTGIATGQCAPIARR